MKNTKRKLLFASSIVWMVGINTLPSYGQALNGAAPDQKTIQNGTSSSLSQVYSSSGFDGTASVNIPIYSYSLGKNNYGVSLAYRTNGVRVDEISLPYGIHWNLFAGATITRVIKDIPDELNYEGPAVLDWTGPNVYPNESHYIRGKFVTYTETSAQLSQTGVQRDGENDDFVFSGGGKSFTFNLGKNLNIFTTPHTNVKIYPTIDGIPISLNVGETIGNGLLEFKIVDEDGTSYFFSRGAYETREITSNQLVDGIHIGTISPTIVWVVTKIRNANGNEINYTYTDPVSNGLAVNNLQYVATENYVAPIAGNPFSIAFGSSNSYSQQTAVKIKSIQYPNNTTVDFVYVKSEPTITDVDMLSEIKISSEGQCKRYQLNQGKIHNRWFLNNIKLLSCDGTATEPYYSFVYNPLELPNRLSPAQDYYGYYNGDSTATPVATQTGSAPSGQYFNIPKHNTQPPFNYGIESRAPNVNFIKAGLLTQVNNAYGGNVTFSYDIPTAVNPYVASSVGLPSNSNYLGTNAFDGVVVTNITESDKFNPTNNRLTTYEYIDGQIFMPGGYFHYPTNVNPTTNNWDIVNYSNMFITPHQFVNGVNHGFSQVNETVYNNGSLIGRSETKYSNLKDNVTNQLNYYKIGKDFFEFPYTDKQYLKEWAIGLPLQMKQYDQNNHIVSQLDNTYSYSNIISADPAFFTNTKTTKINSGPGASDCNGSNNSGWNCAVYLYPNKKVFTDTYVPYTGFAFLTNSVVRKYVSDTRYVEESSTYHYDDRNNIDILLTKNSKGENFQTNYIFSYAISGTTIGTSLYNLIQDGIETQVALQRWKLEPGNLTLTNNATLVQAYINTFIYQGGILRPKGVYDLSIAAPVTYGTFTSTNTPTVPNGPTPPANDPTKIKAAFEEITPIFFEKSSAISLFDDKGNPTERMVLSDPATYTATIWDNLNGNKLAEVNNAKFSDIAYTSFDNANKGSWIYNSSGVTWITNAMNGQNAYYFGNNGNITRTGLTAGMKYKLAFWGSNYSGTPNCTIGGTNIVLTASDVVGAWTYYEGTFTATANSTLTIAGTGNLFVDELRLHPINAGMQTYTYVPFFGIGSMADAYGRITNFEYDKLGRQTLVRDQKKNIISKMERYTAGGL